MYAGAVKTTDADVPEESNGVPIVGTPGILPPESLVAINYAETSPTNTHVSVARLISVAYDHCARILSPGVAFMVTPPAATTVVCPEPVCRMLIYKPTEKATKLFKGTVRLLAER